LRILKGKGTEWSLKGVWRKLKRKSYCV